jgi:cytochrome P450
MRADADAFFADGAIDGDDLMQRLPAVQGAVMEAMRLWPIAVAAMRTATRDFEFCGRQIREGEMLYVATTVPHFMETYYPEPSRFDIDRYEKPRSEHLRPGVYSPYGRGPHICLGKSLAEVLLVVTMARLCHRLNLSLDPPGYVLRTKTAPTPGPAMNFRVKVESHRHPA